MTAKVSGERLALLLVARVWGSARGSFRSLGRSLDFSLVPLSVMRRIVEAEVSR